MPADGDQTAIQDLGEVLRAVIDARPETLSRVSVRSGDCAIEVEWAGPAAPDCAAVAAAAVPAEAGSGGECYQSAPMVGVFYGRPSPDQPPFVKIGDTVESGQQVAVIEAMKLFTPVLSDHDGTVRAVLVEDGEMVEFGQPLMEILPVGDRAGHVS